MDAGGNEVHTVSPFPSWLGLVLGAGISCISALLVYLAWLRGESWWTYPVLAVAVFLYQYFVSLEVIKRIAKALLRQQTGVNLDGGQ